MMEVMFWLLLAMCPLVWWAGMLWGRISAHEQLLRHMYEYPTRPVELMGFDEAEKVHVQRWDDAWRGFEHVQRN